MNENEQGFLWAFGMKIPKSKLARIPLDLNPSETHRTSWTMPIGAGTCTASQSPDLFGSKSYPGDCERNGSHKASLHVLLFHSLIFRAVS